MSTMIMSLCWPIQMPPTPKAVLISLADNANDQGVAWPSLTKICERTCFGRTAVIAAIRWLEDEGLVVADRSNGRHTSYAIDLNAVNQFASRTSPPAEPVRLPNSNQSASRTNQSASRTIPVREADSNRHKPSRTVRSNRHSAAVDEAIKLLPDLPADLVADFVAIRKAKKLPLTGTAVAGLQREADKARLTLEAAVRLCCERGWAALRADWLAREAGQGMPSQSQPSLGSATRELL
ncbi:helix-turn-helix domain-containing protein [Stenotrophomonas maltophilia]|uniref:helix-turn-helix domain-containing protein n=1 Tax=Stenotrophomonas maltophilia TaxID=40324 RepID=UPI001F1D7066|nr:helix-turn-helix domain-containing protein [Stenotrophomonas maltophilia]MCF3519746.1 hypothetical protein [Stenotrophomonas maltophilia]